MEKPGQIFGLARLAALPLLLLCVPGRAFAITSAQCEARVNDTPAKLVECIQQDALCRRGQILIMYFDVWNRSNVLP